MMVRSSDIVDFWVMLDEPGCAAELRLHASEVVLLPVGTEALSRLPYKLSPCQAAALARSSLAGS